MAETDSSIIILDPGSYETKAGLNGDLEPRQVMRTVAGKVKHHGIFTQLKEWEIGEDLARRQALYSLIYPVQMGQITNYSVMEKVFDHMFYKLLEVEVSEKGVMMVEPIFMPFASREWLTQLMFETYGVRSYYAQSAPVLSLYSMGKTEGMAIEMGEGVTKICAVLQGRVLAPGTQEYMVSGRDGYDWINRALERNGVSIAGPVARNQIYRCKNDFCNSVCASADEWHALKPRYYDDADKGEMQVYKWSEEEPEWTFTPRDRFGPGEIYFNPSLLGYSSPDLTSLCHSAYSRIKALKDIRLGVYEVGSNAANSHDPPIVPFGLDQNSTQHIIEGTLHEKLCHDWYLFGGASLIQGMDKRLERELKTYFPKTHEINVIAAPHRKYAAFRGASLYASHSDFDTMKISAADYDEYGPSIIHNRSLGGLVKMQQ